MKTVIIKYNAGNIRSVHFALKRLGIDAKITGDHQEIQNADKVIFPGVGEASTTMQYLKQQGLDVLIRELKQPVLGICLGLQLMCRHSEEGNATCIGIFDAHVRKFKSPSSGHVAYKIPHMGWNQLDKVKGPIFDEWFKAKYVYFVHSFYAELTSETSAVCNYIHPFSAALQKNNFFATQFHPEKSGDVGHRILKKFIEL
jgi:glutamine amidotransferase